ncbi:MAG TPA: hypothetical protein VFG60_06250 [Burkholderiaceae bacterium]|nr:hypothetical protein [Burkholderiaceae bacterium]
MQRHPLDAPRLLLAVLIAAVGGTAWADEANPYYIGASQAFTHDSNVFRLPTGVTPLTGGRGDTYSSTSLLAGFDQPIGRQRVHANARVAANRFQDHDNLDNTSYGVDAGWDWATIEKLSGNVFVGLNQNLASLENAALIPLNGRNLVKTQQYGGRIQWGGASLLTLQANDAHSKVDYSAPSYAQVESSHDSLSLGGYYQLSGAVRLGSAVRFSRTETGRTNVNKTDSHSLDLTADWQSGGRTSANARVSWTKQSNSVVGGRDFSGLTGALGVAYAPTAKLAFTAALTRDAGVYSSFFNLNNAGQNTPIFGLSENSRTTNALRLGARYAATAKISVNAGAQYRRAKLVDAGGAESTDTLRTLSLGADYAIARNWLLACNVSRLKRSIDGSLSYEAPANIASCSAQFTWR